MAAPEDINWLKGTANELNNLLQVITESSHALEKICNTDEDGRRYYKFLTASLDRAIRVAGSLSARIGGEVQTQSTVKPPEPRREAGVPVPPITNPDGARELIMIVDDEEMIRTFVTTFLAEDGYRILAAPDPLRALDAFNALHTSIDLVILDFTLPIMDGSELFDEMRKIKPNVTVMLSSGFAEQAKLSAMLSRGLRGFLPKPYTRAKLLEQVRSTLDAVHRERTGDRKVL